MATAVMDEVRRQRDPNLKAAVLDMIEGAPAEALGRAAAALWLRLSPEARAGTALLDAWMDHGDARIRGHAARPDIGR